MAAVQAKRLYTPEEYLERERAAETRSEYLAGEIFAMAGDSEGHNGVVPNLTAELVTQMRGGPCRALASNMRPQTVGAMAGVRQTMGLSCAARILSELRAYVPLHRRKVGISST
jgi:hypothetical protein